MRCHSIAPSVYRVHANGVLVYTPIIKIDSLPSRILISVGSPGPFQGKHGRLAVGPAMTPLIAFHLEATGAVGITVVQITSSVYDRIKARIGQSKQK